MAWREDLAGITKPVGLDAFALLFGRSRTGMTGAAATVEGALFGFGVGGALALARKRAASPP